MTTNDVIDTRTVSAADAIKFLECACRNWSKVPRLSDDDIQDVAEELQSFLASRHPQPVNEPAEGKGYEAVRDARKQAQEELAPLRASMLRRAALRAASIPAPERDHTIEFGKALNAIRRKAIAFGTRASDGYAEIQSIACDALNCAMTNAPAPERSKEGVFSMLHKTYLRGVGWARRNPGANEAEEYKAAYDYADAETSTLEPAPVPVTITDRPEVNSEREILERLSAGDEIAYSQDGDDAFFTKGDRAFVGPAIIDMRSKGYLKRIVLDPENYRGSAERDVISDAGRAALSAKPTGEV